MRLYFCIYKSVKKMLLKTQRKGSINIHGRYKNLAEK